jgi:hypothetical protein
MKKEDKLILQFLAKIGKRGGKSRAARHDKETLSRWAKLGGRPKGSGKKKSKRGEK